ncbi:hypothetical protein RB195_000970 [Necator americanus]|uniref:Uncharacterized protein n=1 Tax=Necator americanus TaxID=51031 RepID=A0ABR1DC41_NECAM
MRALIPVRYSKSNQFDLSSFENVPEFSLDRNNEALYSPYAEGGDGMGASADSSHKSIASLRRQEEKMNFVDGFMTKMIR